MFDTILVPTDGSDGMARVIDTASELAQAHDAELRFVYAVHTASFANLPLETSWESVGAMLREEGEEALEAARRRATTDRVETAILDGSPRSEILGYAEEVGCDLIVMGTHGRGGLNRLLLGSVAERVVRSARVPVMTVRVGEPEGPPADRSEEQPVTADPSVTEALE